MVISEEVALDETQRVRMNQPCQKLRKSLPGNFLFLTKGTYKGPGVGLVVMAWVIEAGAAKIGEEGKCQTVQALVDQDEGFGPDNQAMGNLWEGVMG